jgi:hypothetical protein
VDCQMRGNSAACFLCCVHELDVPWWRCIVPCLPKNLISPDCPH